MHPILSFSEVVTDQVERNKTYAVLHIPLLARYPKPLELHVCIAFVPLDGLTSTWQRDRRALKLVAFAIMVPP